MAFSLCSCRRVALALIACALLGPLPVRSEGVTAPAVSTVEATPPASGSATRPRFEPKEPGAAATPLRIEWGSLALFTAGVATGFVAHEGCHVAANLAMGNVPTLESVEFLGFIPFFAISPNVACANGHCFTPSGRSFSRQKLFTIVSAGIQCQHYEDELILTLEPRLRFEDAPFRKGLLAFNTLLSVGYVLADWAGAEPENGDLAGLYRDTKAPRHVMNVLVLGVAGVDIARYFLPDVAWLSWVSRTLKVTTTGVVFTL